MERGSLTGQLENISAKLGQTVSVGRFLGGFLGYPMGAKAYHVGYDFSRAFIGYRLFMCPFHHDVPPY
jgi:hypothetical protein